VVEKINLGEISIINGDTLKILNAQVEDKTIILEFEGNKESGNERAQITIKANIDINKATIAQNEKIELSYLTEKYQTDVNLVSPQELILTNEIIMGKKDIKAYYYDIKEETYTDKELEEQIKIKFGAINNTEENIENAFIVGKLGFNEYIIKEYGEFIIPENAIIKFSQNQEGPWREKLSSEDRFFKIEIAEIKKGEEIACEYAITVDKNLITSDNLKSNYSVQYNNYIVTSPIIVLKKDNEIIKEKECDVEYSTQIYYNNENIEKIKSGAKVEYYATISNIKQDLENIEIKIDIPEGTELIKSNLYKRNPGTTQYTPQENAIISIENNQVKIQSSLKSGEEYIFLLEVKVIEIVKENIENNIIIQKVIKNENYSPENTEEPENIYENISNNKYENDVEEKAEKELDITVKSNQENITLTEGAEIIYTVSINNESGKENEIAYEIDIPDEISISKIIIKKNGEIEDILDGANYLQDTTRKIEKSTLVEIILEGKVQSIEEEKTVQANFKINKNNYTLSNKINATQNQGDENLENENNQNPNENENNQSSDGNENNQNSEVNNNQTTENNAKYSLSGIVWLDKDKDGKMDNNEPKIKGVLIRLWNNNEKAYMKDVKNNEIQQISDNDGGYLFENIPNGNYTVIFEYNKNTYSATTYTTVNQGQTDSSAITVTEDSKNITKTDTITISNQNVQNINLGLVFNPIFDLELSKKITKVTVETSKGTEQYEYENGTTLSKIEIDAKQINGAKAIVEYEIKIKNEGAIPGFAKTIVDNIPDGFEFNSELNSNWYKGEDGKIYSKALADTIINSGEEKTIKLILVKTLKEASIGTVSNTAELYEVFNEYALEDKDSTENNQALDEDDYGKADLIISIKTGSPEMYTGLIFVCMAIIGTGIYMVDKKLLRKYEIM